ncbi:T3SS effector HopA1 family protein [Occultella kanbiaonis]|uniref:T3SS effector HopA1 family protein n=1 Tax=Occultella kanbiaonis TaxID=2675754 RepID=UPI0013D57FC2|nr:T3SS effector HopA1 family protein [Occultella kanbiaonis]
MHTTDVMPQTTVADEVEAAITMVRRTLILGRVRSAAELTGQLLRDWYAPATPVPPADPAEPPLAGLLRVAHVGFERWQTSSGWRATSAGHAWLRVEGGRPRTTVAANVVGADAHGALAPTDRVEVREQATRAAGGRWRTWGAGWVPRLQGSGTNLLRIHLNCPADNLPDLVRAVTAHTSTWDEPWALDAPTDRTATARPDATHLTLPVGAFMRGTDLLHELVDALAPLLRPAVPALTLRLAPGVGVGQSAATGPTFGELRCHVLAQTLIADPFPPTAELLRRTRTALAREGIDARRPHRVRDTQDWDAPWL